MSENPFSLNFGIEPNRMISRNNQIDEIVEGFKAASPSTYLYIITGVRGSGKTVTMASIMHRLKADKDWVTVSLNPNRDLLKGLAANLFENPMLKPAFVKADISFSMGVNVSLGMDAPEPDVEIKIKKMLSVLKNLGKKLLVAIDEVTNSSDLRAFASAYQIFLYEGFPFFLIMTGLYDNVRSLQNEKSLTFLYRAPKLELKPLGIQAMANNYKDVFRTEDDEALRMAKFTKGYSYAFQVLGYLKFKRQVPFEMLIPEFDEIMEEYAYEKIWSELSPKDREIIHAIARNGGKMKVQEIIKATGMTSSSFSTYRRRLGKGGILSTEEYGYCEICLPRFKEIVNSWE